MGPYGFGDGELVSALGRLRTTYPGHGGHADCTGHSPHAGAPTFSHRRVEGLYSGTVAGRGDRVSSATSGAGGPQAQTTARGPQKLVLCTGCKGPQQGGPCRGGQQARGLRWPTPFWQAVAPAPTWHDDPDRLHGTLVWHLAWARRAPPAPHPMSLQDPPLGRTQAPTPIEARAEHDKEAAPLSKAA